MDADIEALAQAILRRACLRARVSQAFLFNEDADPFWAARVPVTQEEVLLLGDAVDLIEEIEAKRARPFFGHDARGRFSVTGFSDSSKLYLVCIGFANEAIAEQSLSAIRQSEAFSAFDLSQRLVRPDR